MSIKPKLGQHFLKSTTVAKDMVKLGNCDDSIFLEIGAGKGFLTKHILSTGKETFAVEKDKNLIQFLSDKFENEIESKQLTLINQDVRDLEFNPNKKFIVIANIPYYLTSSLIRKFLTAEKQPEKMVLLVQKELAKRITDKKKESILSLSVKYYADASLYKIVKASSFSPKPKVDSSILLLKNIHRRKREDEEIFFNLVKVAFASKRKLLGNNLKDFDLKIDLLEKLNLPKRQRAEDVPFSKWEEMVKLIKKFQ